MKFVKREKSRITKNDFSCLSNLNLGHLQSSTDENKMTIGKISIRTIQKLADCGQQTIVGGPNCKLTNLSSPSVYKLIDELENLGIIKEITGAKRGKIYMFRDYTKLFN